MQFLNKWITYFDRTFDQIKASALGRVTISNPELTDHNESNPFIILLDLIAGCTEMLGYYIDRNAMEAYVMGAFRRASLLRHAESYDYPVKARSPESVDLSIIVRDSEGEQTNLGSNVVIPAGTVFSNGEGLEFSNISDHTIMSGASSYTLPIYQVAYVNDVVLGTTDGSKSQRFSLGKKYVHNSLSITVGVNVYSAVDTFAHSSPSDNHFKVTLSSDGNAYLVLPDGLKGSLPASGQDITASYRNTEGTEGRVNSNDLQDAQNMPLINGIVWDVNNVNPSSGGSDYESDDSLRTNIPYHNRTLEVAARPSDFWAIAEMNNSVSRAEIDESNIRPIKIYIVPTGGGVASSALLTEVYNELEYRRLVGTSISVKPAGSSTIVMNMNVTPRIGNDLTETRNQVVQALVNWGSDDNQFINRDIRISDIIALVDNLSRVDFMNINYWYLKPYPRPLDDHSNPLNWQVEILSTAITTNSWTLDYTGDNIRVFINGAFQGNADIDSEYVDPTGNVKFTITTGSYQVGNRWSFKTYPYNKDIALDDFTIPTIVESELAISVSSPNIQSRRA